MPHDSRASIAPPSPGSDANDFFGGTRAQLSYDAMPNAHWNDRSESGLRTYDVGMSGPQMQFSVGKGPLPPTDPGAAAAARPAPPVLRGSVSPEARAHPSSTTSHRLAAPWLARSTAAAPPWRGPGPCCSHSSPAGACGVARVSQPSAADIRARCDRAPAASRSGICGILLRECGRQAFYRPQNGVRRTSRLHPVAATK